MAAIEVVEDRFRAEHLRAVTITHDDQLAATLDSGTYALEALRRPPRLAVKGRGLAVAASEIAPVADRDEHAHGQLGKAPSRRRGRRSGRGPTTGPRRRQETQGAGLPTVPSLRQRRCVHEGLRWLDGRRRDPISGHSACPSASLRRQCHRAGRDRRCGGRLAGGHDVDRQPRWETRSHGADIAPTRSARIAASRRRRVRTAGTVALRTPSGRAQLIARPRPRFGALYAAIR
jgi:hypothetical protein